MPSSRPKRSTALTTAGLFATLGAVWLVDARRRSRKTALIHRTMVELLLNTLCSGDPSTARHSRRVADLTDVVGSTFRMNREGRARLRVAALLHDLGKLDDDLSPIIHSDHKLDASERTQVKEHTNESADILQPLEALHPGIGLIVESHHERWDGAGYPQGLSGEGIPLESRIISVADVFDAMTQPRSYKEPLEMETALEEIRKGAGTRFDPRVVERIALPEVRTQWERIAREGQRAERRVARQEETTGAS